MKSSDNNFLRFLRRNAAYLVLALCILAIGLSVTLVLVNKNRDNQLKNDTPVIVTPSNDDQKEPITPDPEPVVKPDPVKPDPQPVDPVVKEKTYILPVKDATSVTEYSEALVFNSTLKRFAAHLAVDFFADEGTPVFAIADGTVESVETTLIYGTTIVIDHGEGLKSVYNSLADGDLVTVGQKIAQGAKIGEVSVSNRQEYKEGAHLHFEITENGKATDPAKYLTFAVK